MAASISFTGLMAHTLILPHRKGVFSMESTANKLDKTEMHHYPKLAWLDLFTFCNILIPSIYGIKQ